MGTDQPLQIDPADARDRVAAGALLLDCRNTDEWQHCRIEGARLIPLDELPERLAELGPADPNRPIVVYCHAGVRSLHAAKFLRSHGHGASSMSGGIDRWSLQIDPTVPRY